MKLPVTVSLVVLGIMLLACGPEAPAATPGVSGEPKTPSTPSTPSATGSPEGGECGDDVAIQKKCAAGLVCTPNPKAPVSEHTPGICKKP